MKAYLSDLFAPLKMAWQEATLAAAVPGWADGTVAIFSDVLNRRQHRHRKTEALAGRAEMLLPTLQREPDTIYLASVCVLACDENDFYTVVREVLARRGVIVAVDEGTTIDGTMSMDEIISRWLSVRKKKRIINAQLTGGQVSAERKKARAQVGVEKIRPYWGMPPDEWPTLKLRQMAGSDDQPMAYNTIVAHIGYGREIARRHYLAALRGRVSLAERDAV